MFSNRIEAGVQLASALKEYKGEKDTVVVAIPRGGIVTGYEIAKRLELPLEVTLVKKLGHPANSELAVGAVSLKGQLLDETIGLSETYVIDQTRQIRVLLQDRQNLYYGSREPVDLLGKTVILVDDGVATGYTLLASIDLIRQEQSRKIVVAIPLGPGSVIRDLERHADEVICLQSPTPFIAIGAHYGEFGQVSDQQVQQLLRDNWKISRAEETIGQG